MKKFLSVLLVITMFSFVSFTFDNGESNKKLTDYKINQKLNRAAYFTLLNDVTELIHQLITNKSTNKKTIKIKELIDKKIALLYLIVEQLNSNRNLISYTGHDADGTISTPTECPWCKTKSNPKCKYCGGDGFGYSPDQNPEKCKSCKGTGKIGGQPCPGCGGTGYANTLPDPPGWSK